MRRRDANEVGLKAQELSVENDKAREQGSRCRWKRKRRLTLRNRSYRAPTQGESGKQVNVKGVGKKAKGIIKEVDKGIP